MRIKLIDIHSLLDGRSKQIFEYTVVFVLIVYSGNATSFTNSLETMANPIGFLLPIVLISILGYLKNIRFNYKFILFIAGFVFYFLASTMAFGQLHPRFFLNHLIRFSLVYILVSSLGILFFRLYEDIMYYLCIIGLLFWITLNIIPTPFTEFLRFFQFSSPRTEDSILDFNVIVFTINKIRETAYTFTEIGPFSFTRNPGFAWEPGVFAALINIAIFFNLVRTRFVLKKNKHLFVFIAALASTFSTTGYSLALLLLVFYLYNQNFINALWLVPVLTVVSFAIFTLPFMSEKITDAFATSGHSTEQLIYLSAKYGYNYIPQRFESFLIDFKDFLNYPLIGYGGHQQVKWTNLAGAQIWTVSGLGKVLGQFGLVGTGFFLFSLWKSSKNIISIFYVRGTIFPVLFILFYSISYSVFSIFVMCIWLLYLSNNKKSEVLRKIEFYKYAQNRLKD